MQENARLKKELSESAVSQSSVVGLTELLCILHPNIMVDHIASHEFKTQPHLQQFEDMALLFIDISGYTALAQRLGQEGAVGTELLSNSLDDYFSQALSIIYNAGGDCVKFCGDALICVFERVDNERSTNCEMACSAALCLQAKLRNFKAADDVVLDLKICLGFGSLVCNYLGSNTYQHYECLLTGSPLDQLTKMDPVASPGEIILSSEFLSQVESIVITEPCSKKKHVRKLRSLKPTLLKKQWTSIIDGADNNTSLLPAGKHRTVKLEIHHQNTLKLFSESAILDRVRGVAGGWSRTTNPAKMLRERISRHEICSTIFLNINSRQFFSKNDTEVLAGLQIAFLAFYAPLRQYGGVLRQFLKDDKGFVAIIIFTGCESNAVSACRCALKIRENFLANDMTSSVGIASGKVFFGPVGDYRRCEMAWIGDSVNLSARLMSKSNEVEGAKPIFCDKTTAENAGGEIYFELHGMVKLKGKGLTPIHTLISLKHKGSVLNSQLSSIAKLSSPSQVFDNLASVHCSVTLDYIIKASRSLNQTSMHNHKSVITTSLSLEREIFAVTFAVEKGVIFDNLSALIKMVRDSVVDYGGELVDANPFLFSDRLVFVVIFIVGDLPVRQYGGVERHRSSSKTLEHALAYHRFLVCKSLSGLDSKHVGSSRGRSLAQSSVITSMSASKGLATIDISLDKGGSLIVSSSAVDKAIRGIYLADEYHRNHLEDRTKVPVLWCEELVAFSKSVDGLFKPTTKFEIFDQDELLNCICINEITFYNMTSLIVFNEPTISSSLNRDNKDHKIAYDNPGISMPFSFVRRFLTPSELLICNRLMEDVTCNPLLALALEGNSIESHDGVISGSCVAMVTVDLLEDFHAHCTYKKRFSAGGEQGLTTELPRSPPLGERRKYSHKIDNNARLRLQRSNKARKIVKILPQLINNLRGGFLLSSSVFDSVLMFSMVVPSQVDSCSYILTKIDKHLKKSLNCSIKSAFVHINKKGTRWLSGFNGGVILVGPEIHDIVLKYNKMQAIFELSDDFDMNDLVDLKEFNDKKSRSPSSGGGRTLSKITEDADATTTAAIAGSTYGFDSDSNLRDDDNVYEERSHIFVHTSALPEDLSSETGTALAIYSPIKDDPNWCSPFDSLSKAIELVQEKSMLVGRKLSRDLIFEQFEKLVLNSDASTTVLEGRAGHGKSVLSREVADTSISLGLNTYYVSASEEHEFAPLDVWITFTSTLIERLQVENPGLTSEDLVQYLPKKCRRSDRLVLNTILPHCVRFVRSKYKSQSQRTARRQFYRSWSGKAASDQNQARTDSFDSDSYSYSDSDSDSDSGAQMSTKGDEDTLTSEGDKLTHQAGKALGGVVAIGDSAYVLDLAEKSNGSKRLLDRDEGGPARGDSRSKRGKSFANENSSSPDRSSRTPIASKNDATASNEKESVHPKAERKAQVVYEDLENVSDELNFFGAQAINLLLFSTFLRNIMTRNGNKCVLIIEDLQWIDSVSWKLLKLLSGYKDKCMIVATTRSLKPSQMISYIELLKNGSNVSRIKLGPLIRSDLEELSKKMLPSLDVGISTFVNNLQKFSNGFPFLALELIKEYRDQSYAFVPKFSGDRPKARLEKDSAMTTGHPKNISGKDSDDENDDLLLLSSNDAYSAEEEKKINFMYSMHSNDDWEHFSVIDTNSHLSNVGGNAFYTPIDFFRRKDPSSDISQIKAQCTISNVQPLEALTYFLLNKKMRDGKVKEHVELECINDHSAIIYERVEGLGLFRDRDVVFKYCWKMVEPGVFVYIASSCTHPLRPVYATAVRMELSFEGHIWRPSSSGYGTSETSCIHFNPKGGSISMLSNQSVTKYVIRSVKARISYLENVEDHGVMELKRLVKKKLLSMTSLHRHIMGTVAIIWSNGNINNLAFIQRVVMLLSQLNSLHNKVDVTFTEKKRVATQTFVILKDEVMHINPSSIKKCIAEMVSDLLLLEREGKTPAETMLMVPHKFISQVAIDLLSKSEQKIVHIEASKELLSNLDSNKFQVISLANHCVSCGKLEDARRLYHDAGSRAITGRASRECLEIYKKLAVVVEEMGSKRNKLPMFESLLHEEFYIHYQLGANCEYQSSLSKEYFQKALSLLPKYTLNSFKFGNYIRTKLNLAIWQRQVKSKLDNMDRLDENLSVKARASLPNLISSLWLNLSNDRTMSQVSQIQSCINITKYTVTNSSITEVSFMGILKTIKLNIRVGDNRLNYLLDLCRHIADKCGNKLCNAQMVFLEGELACITGKLKEGTEKFNAARGELFEIGEINDWIECNLQLVQALYEQGKVGEALSCCEELLANSTLVASSLETMRVLETRAWLAMTLGDSSTLAICEGKLKEMVSAHIVDESYLISSPIAIYKCFESLTVYYDVKGVVNFCFHYLNNLPVVNIRIWREFVTPYCVFDILCTTLSILQNSSAISFKDDETTDPGLICYHLTHILKKFKKEFSNFVVCKAWYKLMVARLDIALNNVAKYCRPDGLLKSLDDFASENGVTIAQAKNNLLWAEHSQRMLEISERLALANSALQVFSHCNLNVDKDAAIMLLVRLDPLSVEFRQMAKMVQKSRRKSSSHSSFFVELDSMEDVPLAGRKEELVTMMRFANSIRAGHKLADAVLVEASAGMGKSALIKNFISDAKASMCNVVDFHVGTCLPFEKNTPWFVFRKIIQSLLKLDSVDIEVENVNGIKLKDSEDRLKEVAINNLEVIVGHDSAQQLHPLLNPLLTFKFNDTSLTASLDAKGRQAKSLNFYYEIIKGYSQGSQVDRGIILVLEDIQWCDSLSWLLMLKCCHFNRCGVVMSSRPNENDEGVMKLSGGVKSKSTEMRNAEEYFQTVLRQDQIQRQLQRQIQREQQKELNRNNEHGTDPSENQGSDPDEDDTTSNQDNDTKKKSADKLLMKIVLGALHTDAMKDHLCVLLDVDSVSRDLIELIEAKSGGNLLFIQEMVASLIDNGLLHYRGSHVALKAADDGNMAVPDNIQEVIISRVDGLKSSQRSLLQTASIIGCDFNLDLLVTVHPATEFLNTLEEDIQELVRKRLVEKVIGEKGKFQFSHKFVQESLYETCLVSTRRTVHRHIAQSLEISKAKDINSYISVIAHHFTAAEEFKDACHYWLLAGDASFDQNDINNAYSAYKKFLALRAIIFGYRAATYADSKSSRIIKKLFRTPFEKLKATFARSRSTKNAITHRFKDADEEEAYCRTRLAKYYYDNNLLEFALEECKLVLSLLGREENFRRLKVLPLFFKMHFHRNHFKREGSLHRRFYNKFKKTTIMVSKRLAKNQEQEAYDDELLTDKIYYDAFFVLTQINFKKNRNLNYFLCCMKLVSISRNMVDERFFMESLFGIILIAQTRGWLKVAGRVIDELDTLSKYCESESQLVEGYHSFCLGYRSFCAGDFESSYDNYYEAELKFWRLQKEELWSHAIKYKITVLYLMGRIQPSLDLIDDALSAADQCSSDTLKSQIIATCVDIYWSVLDFNYGDDDAPLSGDLANALEMYFKTDKSLSSEIHRNVQSGTIERVESKSSGMSTFRVRRTMIQNDFENVGGSTSEDTEKAYSIVKENSRSSSGLLTDKRDRLKRKRMALEKLNAYPFGVISALWSSGDIDADDAALLFKNRYSKGFSPNIVHLPGLFLGLELGLKLWEVERQKCLELGGLTQKEIFNMCEHIVRHTEVTLCRVAAVCKPWARLMKAKLYEKKAWRKIASTMSILKDALFLSNLTHKYGKNDLVLKTLIYIEMARVEMKIAQNHNTSQGEPADLAKSHEYAVKALEISEDIGFFRGKQIAADLINGVDLGEVDVHDEKLGLDSPIVHASSSRGLPSSGPASRGLPLSLSRAATFKGKGTNEIHSQLELEINANAVSAEVDGEGPHEKDIEEITFSDAPVWSPTSEKSGYDDKGQERSEISSEVREFLSKASTHKIRKANGVIKPKERKASVKFDSPSDTDRDNNLVARHRKIQQRILSKSVKKIEKKKNRRSSLSSGLQQELLNSQKKF